MKRSGRREFLRLFGLSTAACLVSGSARGEGGRRPWMSSLGVGLYTLREQILQNPRETVRELAGIGYRTLEASSRDQLGKVVPAAKEFGLRVVSGHVGWLLLPDERGAERPSSRPSWGEVCREAASYGLEYLVIAYFPRQVRTQLDFYRRVAGRLNRAGEICKRHGLQLCYHNHAFEFEILEGTRPFDVLLERLDPDSVSFELDVFWCSIAGLDPARMIRALSGRVPLLHLKDKAPGTPVIYDEARVPPQAFVEVGRGSVDFPSVLRAAAESGVKFSFVEQDHCPGHPLDSLRLSYRYLNSLNL